jgi:hypothetical protein
MEQLKHTQGEWKIDVQSNSQLAITTSKQAICFIPRLSENVEGNTKLIAASPELLNASTMLLLAIKHGDITLFPKEDDTTDYIQIIENAVNKATK